MKYILIKFSSIIIQISKQTQINNTEIILEATLPDIKNYMLQKRWIKESNKRMKAICKFLNENDL